MSEAPVTVRLCTMPTTVLDDEEPRISKDFWILTMYLKNVRDNIPTDILRQIRKEVEGE